MPKPGSEFGDGPFPETGSAAERGRGVDDQVNPQTVSSPAPDGSDAARKPGRAGISGSPPPELGELVRVEDRLSFVYFEHCIINREDNAITVMDDSGTIHLPAANLGVLMLGPGTNITHQAMVVAGENGATVVWVGERGVRMYAFGRPLTHSSALLQRQAALVSNTRKRLGVARAMYQMRFLHEDVSACTMQQLRGREGARIRQVYRHWSTLTGVPWDKRTYDHEDFDAGSEINKALSAAHTCLYAIAHSVIVALGCSPGLGFVHVGHERSFVYDIADLYKAEISIPVAFRTAAQEPDDIGSATRRAMRDAVYDLSLMKRMSRDIPRLLGAATDTDGDGGDMNHVGLWDEKVGEVPAGRSYAGAGAGPDGSMSHDLPNGADAYAGPDVNEDYVDDQDWDDQW